MKRKVIAFIIVFLFTLTTITSIIAKPVDVLLSPVEYGKTSKVIPIMKNRSQLPEAMPVPRRMRKTEGGPDSSPFPVDMVLAYDNGSEASSLGGLASGFHIGVWFQSPGACTLLAIYYYFAAGGAVTYYVSDPSDTIDFLNDYEEYHGGSNPGPSPIETYLHPEVSATAPVGWDTLDITSMPDVAKNVFYAAYIMDDGASSPIIDASVSPPYHTIMQRAVGGGPFGWYSSWHHVYIRALVRMYENPPPMIVSYDKLPNSYITTGRTVTATFSDLGIPLDSTGVVEGWVHYRIDDGMWVSLSMAIVSGDSAYGVWEATLPGINPGHTMYYYFTCKDMQGFITTDPAPSNPCSYTIKEKTDDVLFVNDDYYGGSYSYDVIADVIPTADRWEIPTDGLPGSSVLLAGYNVIIWNTWERSGKTFAADTQWIKIYLEGGGNILVSGMDIAAGEFGYPWGNYTTGPGEFLHDYFGIMGGTDDFATDSVSVYSGVSGDMISGVFENWPITVFPYYFYGPGYNYAGKFDENPDTLQWKSIFYDAGNNCSAFRYEHPGSGYKVVWLYFPFAYIEDSANPYTPQIEQQEELFEKIIAWFSVPIVCGLTHYYTTINTGPYPVSASVINFSDSLLYVDLIYSANGIYDTIPMTPVKKDSTVYTANIPEFTEPTDVIYYVEAMDSDSNTAHSEAYEFWFIIPSANVLYVNESWDPVLDYRDVLDSLEISGGYDIYEPSLYGKPDSTVLPAYTAVLWNGDYGYNTILTKPSAENVLHDYMLKGGYIFFSSDEILGLWDNWNDVDYYPGEFPYDVLKVNHIYNDICYDSVYGVAGDTITDGITAKMTFPFTNWNDEVDILPAAIKIFTNASGINIRGDRWFDANNKVVFLPFMYVSLPKTIQIMVMKNVLRWFGVETGISSGNNEDIDIPRVFALSQNKPNPFRGRTTIRYAIPRKAKITLKVYNAAGQIVRTLVNGTEEPGYKSVVWNGLAQNKRKVSQGVYFYKLNAGSFRATKKMLILR